MNSKKNHTEFTRNSRGLHADYTRKLHGFYTDYTRILHGNYTDLIFEFFSHYEEPAVRRGTEIAPSLRGACCTAWHRNRPVIARRRSERRGNPFYSFTTVPPFIKRPVIISFFGSKFSGFSILLIRASAIARPIVSPFCS